MKPLFFSDQVIIGHQKQQEFLQKMTESQKIPHALLFVGQEKLGKKKVALQWVSDIFKEDLSKKNHPDFFLIEPVNKEIQISQIRDLSWKLSLKNFSAPLKVVVIDQAHLMNAHAQNSLLKTLEEPQGKTLLILISEYPNLLFSTILSRVQKIKFFPVEKRKIQEYLKKQGFSEKDSRKIADFSLGSPGIAIDFANMPDKLKDYDQKIEELVSICSSNLAFRFNYAKDISKKTDLKEILNVWLFYFRNILISKIKKESLTESEKNFSLVKLKNILFQIQETKSLISNTNVDSRLALENLMLEL